MSWLQLAFVSQPCLDLVTKLPSFLWKPTLLYGRVLNLRVYNSVRITQDPVMNPQMENDPNRTNEAPCSRIYMYSGGSLYFANPGPKRTSLPFTENAFLEHEPTKGKVVLNIEEKKSRGVTILSSAPVSSYT